MNIYNYHYLLDSLQLATGQEASEIMLQAILYQRKEFIDLLIMNGFLMQAFLTVKNLRILYQEGVNQIIVSKINVS